MLFELLYTLERVRAACRPEHGCFHTFYDPNGGSSEDHRLCQKLAADGLVREGVSEPGHSTWTMV